METVAVLIFGGCLLLCGIVWLLMCLDRRVAPFLQFIRMLRNWGKMFVQTPASNGMVGAAPVSFRSKVQHNHGYYFINQGTTLGSALRVHVPPDFVARLAYTDRWSNSRLLEVSSFCLRTDDGSDLVEFISRGRRWCLDFDDDTIRARDGYLMNCQVAVHWYVPLTLENEDHFHKLFDELPNIMKTLEDSVAGVLRQEFKAREYRDSMYNVPAILANLNKHWKTDQRYEPYRDLVQIEFTALMIRPREEAERKFLDLLGRKQATVGERIDEIDKEIFARLAHINDRWTVLHRNLKDSLVELDEQLPMALKSQSQSVKTIVVKQGTTEDAIAQARGVFDAGVKQLAECSDRMLQSLKDLEGFVLELDARTKEYLRKPTVTAS